jgi:cytosine deaminase
VQDSDRARSTIDLVRAARIGIISLPLCNAYLQDRRTPASPFPRTPRWRGVTLIHDLLAAGVPVACAGDNVRDAFYAYGNYDMFEVYLESVRLAHLDSTLADSVRVVTSTAADLVGLPTHGRIAPGSPAHLVAFDAHSFCELLSRPATPRRCIDGELVHTPRVPDFSELGDRPV